MSAKSEQSVVKFCLPTDQVKVIFTEPVSDQGKQWRWKPTIMLATSSTPGTDPAGLCS